MTAERDAGTTVDDDPSVRDAKRRLDQARARRQRARALASARHRKLDARRKIILGGALLERAKRGGSAESDDAARLVQEILRGLTRANDKKAFEGFEL